MASAKGSGKISSHRDMVAVRAGTWKNKAQAFGKMYNRLFSFSCFPL